MSKKVFDAFGKEVEIKKDSFSFVQFDKKISDTKIEAKPTTFFKDAVKRFRKNKSSVAGAIILASLLLGAIIIPIFSPFNVKDPELKLAFLEPKVFKAGTGFWDGTKEYYNQIYDVYNETPVNFEKNAIVKITATRESLTTTATEYGHGGTFIFEADGDTSVKRGFDYMQHNTKVNVDVNDDWKINYEFDKVDTSKYVEAEFRIVICDADRPNTEADVASGGLVGRDIVLLDWTSSSKKGEIDISKKLKEEKISKFNNSHVRIDVKHSYSNLRSALYIKEFNITSSNESLKEKLEEISITDGNYTAKADKTSLAYWYNTGVKSVCDVEVTYVDFIYDVYEAKLGLQEGYVIGQNIMDGYIEKGYCTYDYKVGPTSFKSLSDKCPIVSVESQQVSQLSVGTVTNLICEVEVYKVLGFKKMPSFMFGTDSSGFDLVTQVFTGLSFSLLVAIAASAINFTIGLLWGSISGYFGGTVDLVMERFCEILGGMPWIVMMTLIMLLIGKNLFTFVLALCITGWMGTAGRTRTQFYRFKGREYVLSSRTLGSSDFRLIFKHILPNALGTIITGAVLMIPGVIGSEATLAYLNLFSTDTQSFGVILSINQAYLGSHPALILFPGAILSLIMITFNLFGNGLRDALNPSLKGLE